MAEAEAESEEDSEESEVEWEDVEALPSVSSEPSTEQLEAIKSCQGCSEPSQALAGSLEIVLDRKAQRKSKKEKDHLEKAITSFNKEVRCNQHKVHLLCLVARGLKLSQQCDDLVRQGLLFSFLGVDSKHLVYDNTEEYNQGSVLKILKWFSSKLNELHRILRESASQGEGYQFTDVQLLVTLLRTLGLRTRLVMVLNPMPFKESKASGKRKFIDKGEKRRSSLTSDNCKDKEGGESLELKSGSLELKSEPSSSCDLANDDGVETTGKRRKGFRRSKGKGMSSPPSSSSSHPPQRKTGRQLQSTKRRRFSDGTAASKNSPYFKEQMKSSPYFKNQTENETCSSRMLATRRKTEGKQSSGSDGEYVPDGRRSQIRPKKRSLSRTPCSSSSSKAMEDSDGDFQQPKKKRRKSSESVGASPAKKLSEVVEQTKNLNSESEPKALRSRSKGATSRKSSNSTSDVVCADSDLSLSSRGSSESVEITGSEETADWAEVYLSSEVGGSRAEKMTKKWICVHLPSCSINQRHLCEKHCTLPLSYVIAIENGLTVRDVTARYASNWCTHARKQRLSEEWWEESLRPFESPDQDERDAEEEDILSILYAQPRPTSIADYKNHPLYVLRRHLLKFEAIYPEESQILGYCKGEPVYARECVHTLHTRETWLKEGRVVRVGEKAYKMVKARPKRGLSVLEVHQNSTVEVFGRWQTEVYIPPPIVNGKVPRNEYGNIELFLPSMLPLGGCHIKIQGIQKVARKLDIDYAPAMVGWDFHSGYCHPIIDGIVVAEEHEQVLREAWQQQEQLLIEKDIKKREKRVLERWRKLARGVLIRERVKRTYELVDTSLN